jgi:hypothetical protein
VAELVVTANRPLAGRVFRDDIALPYREDLEVGRGALSAETVAGVTIGLRSVLAL